MSRSSRQHRSIPRDDGPSPACPRPGPAIAVAGAGARPVLAALALAVAVFGASAPAARANDTSTEIRITAALVYNFCKFVAWPQAAEGELVLGVTGGPELLDGFGGLAGKGVGRQSLAVVAMPDTASMAKVGLVYLSAGQSPPVEDALACLRGRPVLTISDSEGFCDRGGMIELSTVRGKIRFTINAAAARQAGLDISSQLLKMAQQVVGNE